MESWKMRLGTLEARSCNENLLREGEHTTIEIVEWENVGNCYVIAYFNRDKEGDFDLTFINHRPFDVDPNNFFVVASEAYRYLRHQIGHCCH